ncbi:MAG: T9SS type A sorting domain-containing protein [Chlorobi bacterium]|nr:T9SS type A sorting domain-containing protein [Chlorobiota bacterium]
MEVIGLDTTTSVPLDFVRGKNPNNRLSIAIPNPFSDRTILEFNVGAAEQVTLEVFDERGQFVEMLIREELEQGAYQATWDGASYASGTYYLRLVIGEWNERRRVVILK